MSIRDLNRRTSLGEFHHYVRPTLASGLSDQSTAPVRQVDGLGDQAVVVSSASLPPLKSRR